MIKIKANKDNDYQHCYQVNGIISQNNKEIKAKVFVFADDEIMAKETLNDFRRSTPIKYNLQTLGDAQRAYKKEYGVEVDLDSEEFQTYIN